MSPGFIPEDYEPVEDRLRAFWSEHRDGRVTTDLVTPDAKAAGDVIVFKASVWRGSVDGLQSIEPDATGYAHQRLLEHPPPKRNGQPNVDAPEWTSPWEVAETSAIGRALANLGYAAKGKRPSREEISKASAGTAETGTSPSVSRQSPPSTATPVAGDGDMGSPPSSPSPSTSPQAPARGDGSAEGGPAFGEGAAQPPSDPNPSEGVAASAGSAPPSDNVRRDKLWSQLVEYAGSKKKAVNAVNKECKAGFREDQHFLITELEIETTLRKLLQEIP